MMVLVDIQGDDFRFPQACLEKEIKHGNFQAGVLVLPLAENKALFTSGFQAHELSAGEAIPIGRIRLDIPDAGKRVTRQKGALLMEPPRKVPNGG